MFLPLIGMHDMKDMAKIQPHISIRSRDLAATFLKTLMLSVLASHVSESQSFSSF